MPLNFGRSWTGTSQAVQDVHDVCKGNRSYKRSVLVFQEVVVMKGQGQALFEAPLAHEATHSPHPYASEAIGEFETVGRLLRRNGQRARMNRRSPAYIRWVQMSLNRILGMCLAVDGIMGMRTRNTIRSFQQRRGLVVDGIVGPKTEAALMAAGGRLPLGFGITAPRPFIQMRPGKFVGEGRFVGDVTRTNNNLREDVLNTMDRLHLLWSISNPDYDREYPAVASHPPGSFINPADIRLTIAAIRRNQAPTLHRLVVEHFLALSLSGNVGLGQANNNSDILQLQDALLALNQINPTEYKRERGAVLAIRPMPIADSMARIPETLKGISRLKDAVAGGRLGWAPIHADEGEAGGDRFGGQTYDCGDYSVFVPKGARAGINKVHIFFSPGDVTGDSGFNAVLTHGLRSASDALEWILISVPGKEPGFVTTSTPQISDCLTRIGRSPNVNSLRLSAHSRGYRGLRETIGRGLINTSLVERVVILDANYDSIANTLRRSRIPPNRVIAYGVNTGKLPLAGARNIPLPPLCMRAIGYSRLIQDAMVTRPSLPIPGSIRSQLLTLPARGCFTTGRASSGCQVNIIDFCNRNRGAINTTTRQEDNPSLGLKRFIDDNDLVRFGQIFDAGIYSHHFFVAEIAHEIID